MKRNPVLEAVTNPAKNFLATFLISIVLFNLISDGLSSLFWGIFSEWLKNRLGIIDKNIFQFYAVAVLIAIVLIIIYGTNWAQKFKNILAKLGIIGTQIPAQATLVELKETCAGLVVIMSLQPQNSPAEVAIRYHWNNGKPSHLQHCWVICTKTSFEYAKAMKQRFMEEDIDENQLHLYYGTYQLNDPDNPSQSLTLDDCDADDPEQVLRLVNLIYADAEAKGLSESEVIVDFTGGTKPLSIGAFLACASPERRLEYLTQTKPPKIVEVQISYKLKKS